MLYIAATDLWSSLGQIGIVLGLLSILAVIVVWRGRRAGRATLALDVTYTLSCGWIAMCLLAVCAVVVRMLTGAPVDLPGMELQGPWPTDLPCVQSADDARDAMLTCGSGSVSWVSIEHASVGVRTLSTITQVLAVAWTATPAVLLAVICRQTLRGRPFSDVLVHALGFGGLGLFVTGLAVDVLTGVTGTLALREAIAPESAWYPSTFPIQITPLPVLTSVALVALAAVFREGVRLQREKQRLEKDTEGLV